MLLSLASQEHTPQMFKGSFSAAGMSADILRDIFSIQKKKTKEAAVLTGGRVQGMFLCVCVLVDRAYCMCDVSVNTVQVKLRYYPTDWISKYYFNFASILACIRYHIGRDCLFKDSLK